MRVSTHDALIAPLLGECVVLEEVGAGDDACEESVKEVLVLLSDAGLEILYNGAEATLR